MGKKHKKHKSEKKHIESEEVYSQEVSEKPLKLVLKVGGAQVGKETIQDVYSHSPRDRHEEKKHKHKKKKKKKDREREKEREKDKDKHKHDGESSKRKLEADVVEVGDTGSNVAVAPPPAKQALIVPKEPPPQEPEQPSVKITEMEVTQPKSLHPSPSRNEDSGVILRQCLHYLQKKLQGKDVNGFFAFPVTDAIAPGYSSIITSPMDFRTCLAKIMADEYSSVMEYRRDFITMCNNAMTYNRPETIYYKEAKRILQSGLKLLTKEKLLYLKKNQSFLAQITMDELGFPESGEPVVTDMVMVIDEEELRRKELKKIQKSKSLTRFEAIPDNMSPEEILAQAQAAAKEVKEELTLRNVNSKFGFLRKKKDGTTSLTVLNPDNDGKVSETEKIVSLGELAGRLTTGSGNLAGFKEDKRNKVSSVTYLNYGPFSSFAPQYDSAFSSISKEESDILLSTYGDETGAQYAKSVMSFVEGAEDYGIKMVDNLLDILTKGQHSKTKQLLDQKRKSEAEQILMDEAKKTSEGKDKKIDYNSIRSLSDLGMDVSFVDYYEKEIGNERLQARLDQNAGLISDLQQTQKERLGQNLPAHLTHVAGPSEKEVELAEKVSKELQALAKEAVPKDIASVKAVRSAMGITSHVKVERVSQPLTTSNGQTDIDSGLHGLVQTQSDYPMVDMEPTVH